MLNQYTHGVWINNKWCASSQHEECISYNTMFSEVQKLKIGTTIKFIGDSTQLMFAKAAYLLKRKPIPRFHVNVTVPIKDGGISFMYTKDWNELNNSSNNTIFVLNEGAHYHSISSYPLPRHRNNIVPYFLK